MVIQRTYTAYNGVRCDYHALIEYALDLDGKCVVTMGAFQTEQAAELHINPVATHVVHLFGITRNETTRDQIYSALAVDPRWQNGSTEPLNVAPQGMPPSAHHIWDWNTLAWVDPRTLDGLKADKNAEINATRAALNTTSFIHDGKTFSCDSLSRSDIDGVNGYVALYGVLPPDFPGAWKAIDNSYYPLADVAAWKAFYAAMVSAGTANFIQAQQLKAQLAAATTAEEVAAIQWV